MSDSREARFLLAILRERWDDAESIARRRAVDSGRILALARECDVHPTLHALVDRAGRRDLVGEEAWRELSALRRKTRIDNLLLLAHLEKVLDALLGAGIVPVALKGVDTLHRLYGGFDERTLDDIDLLVPKHQLEAALAALEKAGWEGPAEPARTHWLRSSFEMPLTSPGPVKVNLEIHWSLGQDRRYRVTPEALIERAPPLAIAGRAILRLADHDAAAHLLLHHLQHYFDRRLKWALDLRKLSHGPGFDWGTVAERLEEWGGRAAAGMSLLHLGKLFPDLVPEHARALLPAAAWRRTWTSPLRSGHPLDLFRWTRTRPVQLYLAAALLEHPSALPAYILHRRKRDRIEPAA